VDQLLDLRQALHIEQGSNQQQRETESLYGKGSQCRPLSSRSVFQEQSIRADSKHGVLLTPAQSLYVDTDASFLGAAVGNHWE
jgi:hypothetical protein